MFSIILVTRDVILGVREYSGNNLSVYVEVKYHSTNYFSVSRFTFYDCEDNSWL